MSHEKSTNSLLLEKWDSVLNDDKVGLIEDPYKAKVTAQLLENQEKFLNESSNQVAGIAGWDPILMGMARRLGPKLIAYDLCGVQPMTMPTGLVFALKARYAGRNGTTPGSGAGSGETPQGGAEALFNEARTNYAGTGSHVGDNPWDPGFATGTGKATAAGETDAWASMGITIEKTNVVAETMQLRADYSLELAQDMRAVHGLDADAELTNICSTELIAEVNRQVVRKIYAVAKPGAQWTGITTAGQYDLNADADGRWMAERFKGLMFAIERDANAIAIETRRGKGNILITSSDVASALAIAGALDYAPAIQTGVNLDVDATGAAYAGTMGRFKVYVDPYLGVDGYVVGFKGANQYDAGFFYCPYVPLQLVRATDPVNFHPALGFKTRFGMVANPFTTLNNNQNVYYRKTRILNLM